jgi:hypothetical protein
MIAPLDQVSDVRHAGRAEQLSQLGELLFVALGTDGDKVGTLARATLRPLPVQRRLTVTLLVSLHKS